MPLVPALPTILHNQSLRHWMILSTVNCDMSCVPSFVFTKIFGCPCKPLRYNFGPNLSRSSSLYSASQSFTSISHSANFSSIRPSNCGTCSSSLRSVIAENLHNFRRGSQFNLLNVSAQSTCRGSSLRYHCKLVVSPLPK